MLGGTCGEPFRTGLPVASSAPAALTGLEGWERALGYGEGGAEPSDLADASASRRSSKAPAFFLCSCSIGGFFFFLLAALHAAAIHVRLLLGTLADSFQMVASSSFSWLPCIQQQYTFDSCWGHLRIHFGWWLLLLSLGCPAYSSNTRSTPAWDTCGFISDVVSKSCKADPGRNPAYSVQVAQVKLAFQSTLNPQKSTDHTPSQSTCLSRRLLSPAKGC